MSDRSSSPLRERRRQAAVEEIVGAAIDLFSRDGFQETAVDAIVETAGCSRRTFYRYFGTKEDILFYDVADVLERLGTSLDRRLAMGETVWSATAQSLIESQFAEDRPVERMRLWLDEPALRARYMEHIAAAERTIVDCIERHRDRADGRGDEARLIAIAAVGAYRTSIATHPSGSTDLLTRHLHRLLAIVEPRAAPAWQFVPTRPLVPSSTVFNVPRPQTLMERRKQAAIEEIVSAALDLFDRNGFEETTVDAIADAAGCSRRTFYRYFGSKEDMLFYDLPDAFEELGERLDGHLAEGFALWDAVSEAVLELIARFPDDERPVHRMALWLNEPALQARYMQYVSGAEATIVDSLVRYRGTRAGSDDLAQIMAITAVGAYRTTIITHPAGPNRKLTKHLRELLALLDVGLGRSGDATLQQSPASLRAPRAGASPKAASHH